MQFKRDAQHEIIDLSALAEAADKPMFRALSTARHRGEVKDTRWSAYARTDLVDRTGDTGLNLYVDGGAGSYMFRFPGDYRRLFFLRREAAFFPYYFSSRERALIIGPGGGADVLYALMTGWRRIEAVEINPEIRRAGSLIRRVQRPFVRLGGGGAAHRRWPQLFGAFPRALRSNRPALGVCRGG